MGRNVEIKAKVAHPEAVRRVVEAAADGPPERIPQEDVFFHTAGGRLKLRIFDETRGELIYYERPDQSGPKLSSYHITPTHEPASLRETLTLALGVRGVVRKVRTLYLIGRTRVHLDAVEDLGEYLELEVVLRDGEAEEKGEEEAFELLGRFGISPDALEEGAYLDLLAGRCSGGA